MAKVAGWGPGHCGGGCTRPRGSSRKRTGKGREGKEGVSIGRHCHVMGMDECRDTRREQRAPEEVSTWMRSCSQPMITDQKGEPSRWVAREGKAGCVRMVCFTASYT